MRLTLAQDNVLNGIVGDLEAISQGKDLIIGGLLTKSDMMRIATADLAALSELWGEINALNPVKPPTLGYKPCPWGTHHMVMPLSGSDYIACTYGQCPIRGIKFTRLDWDRRD